MKRMKMKFQRFLLALFLITLQLNYSLTIGDGVVHIKFHLPPNAVLFGQPKVIHHTHTPYENHNRRRNPSSSGSVPKQPSSYRSSYTEKTKNVYADSHGELDEPKTQESTHTYNVVERMSPKIYHHDERYDEAYNYRTSADGYYSHFKDPDNVYFSSNQQPSQPIRTFEHDDREYEQEPTHYRHQSPPRDFERDLTVHDSYISDSRPPYNYNTRNSALKVIEPELSHHYSKHNGSGNNKISYRKSKTPLNSLRLHNHKYSNEDRSNNEPLTIVSSYDEPKPMKSHYRPMPNKYNNQEPMDMMSGYHRHHNRAPPKYVKFTANNSYQPPRRYQRPTPHSSFKSSESYISVDNYRAKPTRDFDLQGQEYLASYPWL